jgi:HNH endonuclease
MSAPTIPTPDLTGKRFGWWYVVAYAGQRDGVNYWQCQCCLHVFEKVVAEPDILNRKTDPLSKRPCDCPKPNGLSAGCICGLWTVIELADQDKGRPSRGRALMASWKCRCACGTKRALKEEDLIRFRPLSCGCRPDQELRREWWSRRQRAWHSFSKAMNRAARQKRDSKWTRAMRDALRALQPACVLCGAADDLTTHHVRPFSKGHGLKPGNAVRLCRACNSFIHDSDRGQLSPGQARALETAAAQFKEFWESGCVTPGVLTATPTEEAPKVPDPAFIALLRAVECGGDTGISALANWLEERGDPRATAIRDVIRLEAAVTAHRTGANEVSWSVDFRLDGRSCGGLAVLGPRSPGETESSLAQQVEELRRRHQSDEVWTRPRCFGLSWALRDTLKQYLGINPSGVPATIEEIAKQEAKREQTIRNRIELALHRLTVPRPRRGRQW